ncbi:MAG: hypothetical protein Kow0076_6700 [Francisella sp.]
MMKKVSSALLSLALVSGVYADSYIMYTKPDTNSSKIATIDDQDVRYKVIFSKSDWVEVVDTTNGNVGWIQKKFKNSKVYIDQDPIEKMLASFKKQQELLDEHFNKMLANIDSDIAQVQFNSGSTQINNQPQVFKKFSSLTIHSDGKTAKIVKKVEDSNGNVQTVEKEVPASQLNTIEL